MKNRILMIILILIIQGCSSKTMPERVHDETTHKITSLEREGDLLEKEGEVKLKDLVDTLNQSIN